MTSALQAAKARLEDYLTQPAPPKRPPELFLASVRRLVNDVIEAVRVETGLPF